MLELSKDNAMIESISLHKLFSKARYDFTDLSEKKRSQPLPKEKSSKRPISASLKRLPETHANARDVISKTLAFLFDFYVVF